MAVFICVCVCVCVCVCCALCTVDVSIGVCSHVSSLGRLCLKCVHTCDMQQATSSHCDADTGQSHTRMQLREASPSVTREVSLSLAYFQCQGLEYNEAYHLQNTRDKRENLRGRRYQRKD